jgi:diaminopimelate epimerase
MRIELTKHHALGNDFLVLLHPADAGLTETDHSDVARRLCDRRRGIGADGLLIGEPVDGFAASMVLYNADGSRAEMSGNGIRCFAQALAERRGELAPQRILTDAGARVVTLTGTDRPDTIHARVGMGRVAAIDAPATWNEVGVHPDRPVMHLTLGNPHAVVAVDDVTVVDIATLGRKVPLVNLEIVEPGPEAHAITMRVHERGAGVTEACGTGACASAWAAVAWGLVSADAAEILVHMDGGDAMVRLNDPERGHVTLIGPAVHVANVVVELSLAASVRV